MQSSLPVSSSPTSHLPPPPPLTSIPFHPFSSQQFPYQYLFNLFFPWTIPQSHPTPLFEPPSQPLEPNTKPSQTNTKQHTHIQPNQPPSNIDKPPPLNTDHTFRVKQVQPTHVPVKLLANHALTEPFKPRKEGIRERDGESRGRKIFNQN